MQIMGSCKPSLDRLGKLPDRLSPVKARAEGDRLRRLAALTGLRRRGFFASKRSWLDVSEIAPAATQMEVTA
jgi:hypothetical protein